MPFDLQPVLKGGLLELRPLCPEHFDELFAVASDPLLWEQHPNRDRCEEKVFRPFFQQGLDCGGALVAVDSKEDRIIGSSRFIGHDEAQREIEIGYTFLARSHWGGVYNGEMKRLMLNHVFQFVDSVIFSVGPQNWRSQKAVEKIGGVRVGTRQKSDGSESLIYRITPPQFKG